MNELLDSYDDTAEKAPFSCPEAVQRSLKVKTNVLKIPEARGNEYFVQEGDTKALLCGSEENFRLKNGTDIFYIGMRIRI